MLALILILAASAEQAAANSAIEAWHSCLYRFTENGALTADPAPVVIEAAFYACESEQSKAVAAWRAMIFKESVYHPSAEDAATMADNAVRKFGEGYRPGLLTNIQYRRQLRALERNKRP